MTLLHKNERDRLVRFLVRNGTALLLCAGLFVLVYQVVLVFRQHNNDYIDHMLWAVKMDGEAMVKALYKGRDRLWHTCVQLLHWAGVSNIWKCAALVTAAADAAAYFLIFKTWDRTLPERMPRWLLAVLVGTVFVVGSLTVPGQPFYTDRGSVNTWHNPTNIMVRPFAAAVFYMTANIYERRRYGRRALADWPAPARSFSFDGGFWAQFRQPVFTRAELVLYPLCLLLSVYAKPSFLQFFAPAIFLFLLIDLFRTRGKLLPFCIKLALAFLPAVFILSQQYFHFFSGGVTTPSAAAEEAADSSGIAIYFLDAAFAGPGDFLSQLFTALVRTLWVCAFPLFILILCPRGGAALTLGGVCAAVGRLESLVLHETGARASHGNFTWGYMLASWLFWSAAIVVYAQLCREKSTAGKLARWGGTALLLWHLTCGVVYITIVLRTGQHYF